MIPNLLKRIQPDELLNGIRAAASGASLLDPTLVEMVFKRVRGELTGDSLLDRLSGQLVSFPFEQNCYGLGGLVARTTRASGKLSAASR